MTVAALVTNGIGPETSIPLLLTGGLFAGAAVEQEQPAGKATKRKLPRYIKLKELPEKPLPVPEVKRAKPKQKEEAEARAQEVYRAAADFSPGLELVNGSSVEIINRYQLELEDEERFILYLATKLD